MEESKMRKVCFFWVMVDGVVFTGIVGADPDMQ